MATGCDDEGGGDGGSAPPAPPAPGGGLAGGPVRPGNHLSLHELASGFDQPLGLVPAPGSGDLYVVEQPGRVRLLAGGGPGATLIDIRDRVLSGGEQGLLGLAFHPRYAENGRLFVHYTNRDGDTRVDEYRARRGSADLASRRELLAIEDPYPNHNGGQLSFGPDGLLYLGMGDGGDAFDPQDNAQDLEERLGKLLRLDADDPRSDWRPVAYGLRNPWRFSWDRETGSLWIGDVGQDEREEIDVIRSLGETPPNFGWPAFEGRHDPDERTPRGPGRLIFPAAEYEHEDGHCSITGGYVYRGREVASMRGRYVYADVCSGMIWTLRASADGASDVRREDDRLEQLASFGEDARGELYALSLTGSVFRLGESD
jgi:glucose/arabinose dehydrogenase